MAEPTIARKRPFAVVLEPGTYHWCACGDSKNQPFCDGAHQGTAFSPEAFEMKVAGTARLCGCKHSIDAPYCDGTHTEL